MGVFSFEDKLKQWKKTQIVTKATQFKIQINSFYSLKDTTSNLVQKVFMIIAVHLCVRIVELLKFSFDNIKLLNIDGKRAYSVNCSDRVKRAGTVVVGWNTVAK